MPRQYSMGGRATSGAPRPGSGSRGTPPKPAPKNLGECFTALRNLPPFLGELWFASPSLLLADLVLRGVRAILPIATLYVGKLIIDEVVALLRSGVTLDSLGAGLASGDFNRIGLWLGCEFGLAVLSDLFGRLVSLADSLLSEKYTNATSIRLMQHAAMLDLENFEDAAMQDRLDRARRQTAGRSALMGQMFGQAQDALTVLTFAAGLLVHAPWLMVLLVIALVPAFSARRTSTAELFAQLCVDLRASRARFPAPGRAQRRYRAVWTCPAASGEGCGRARIHARCAVADSR